MRVSNDLYEQEEQNILTLYISSWYYTNEGRVSLDTVQPIILPTDHYGTLLLIRKNIVKTMKNICIYIMKP